MRSFLFLVCVFCAPASGRAERPNVLFIAIDDLRTDLGCYGNSVVLSPNIDALAKRGTLFNKAYCQQAVCNPSRASLLTGLRLNTLRMWDLPTHFRQRVPEIVTLPQMFKDAGYFTAGLGKIFHNWRQDDYKGDAKSWSSPELMHYNSHANDKARVEGEVPPNLSDVPKCVIRDVPDDAYFDGRIADKAVQTLQSLKDKQTGGDSNPFFLAVGFWKPHSHFNAPKKYWDLYERSDIKPAANPEPPVGVPDIALHSSQEILRSFKGRLGVGQRKLQTLSTEDAITLRHGYYANISYMDAQVGKVLDELNRLKLGTNTIIVLWSDHGFHLGEHGLWAKTSNFELDARVPFIIATPNAPAKQQGQRTDSVVELLDIYPTLADLCELKPPHKLGGKSLRPLLNSPTATVKSAALTQHCRPAYPKPGTDPEAMGYSIRTQRYRYTEWRDFKTGSVLATELYDHSVDPDETKNVAEQNRAALARLKKQMNELVDHDALLVR